jgi:hypothetical protein
MGIKCVPLVPGLATIVNRLGAIEDHCNAENGVE